MSSILPYKKITLFIISIHFIILPTSQSILFYHSILKKKIYSLFISGVSYFLIK